MKATKLMQRYFSYLATIGVLCILYFYAGKLGLSLAVIHPSATVVWPPTGIALAAVLLLGNRVWPGILLSAFLVNVTTAGSIATSLGIATGNTLEALFGAFLARRFAKGSSAFDRADDLVKFVVLVGMTSTMISATLGVTSLCLGGFADWDYYGAIWITWWLGDLTSDLVVAPLLLVWGAAPLPRWQSRSMLDTVSLLLLVFVFGQMVFGGWIFSDIKYYPLSFLCILPLLLSALRFGQHGAVTAAAAMSATAIWGTVHGFGPFAVDNPYESLLLLQAFTATNAVSTLVLASVLSERRQAEETLRQSEERFRHIVESAPNGFVMVDQEGKIVLANSQAEQLFGYTKEELLDQPIETLVPARYHGMHAEHRETFFALPQSRTMGAGRDLYGVRKDGSEFPVEIGLNPLETPRGIHVLASVVDITERKTAEDRLRQSEERFRSMIENVKEHAIFMLDREGGVLTWSKGAERNTGYREDEIVGRPYAVLFPTGDQVAGRVDQILRTALSEGQCEEEGWCAHKDGSKFWADVVITPVRNRDGKLIGFSNVTRDLTRHRRTEENLKLAKEEAEAANEAKSAFLANISHEIRTPMTGIIGMAGLLFDTELSHEQREYCEIIRRSSESLLTVINEVLDFSKAESGKLDLEIIDFDLRGTVEDVINLFAKQAQDKGIELINFIRYDVPMVLQGDPGRLRQVLSNLVSNALKYTEEGEVVVRVVLLEENATHATLRFSVTDSGIGISKEKLGKLFHSFTQVDASITRQYGGTGLGLAICKKLVELMGGEIGVYSDVKKGSTFWVTLQLLKRHEGVRESMTPRTSLHGTRVLIVERNSTICAVLEHYLSSLGIESHSAEDGETALKRLRTAVNKGEPYDLAILDFRLPGMDGLELARMIRQEPGIGSPKLLLLTSVGQRGDRILAQEAGVDAYLTKPVSFSYLSECLAILTANAPKEEASLSLVTRHALAKRKQERRLRLLVADDNHINQKVAVSLLEKMGHRADVVGNGKEALEAFKLVPYDIILMDVQMPEMDGFEASRQIRAIEERKGRHTPIIAITAHARKEDREKCLVAGIDDYVSKPIKPEDLKAAIARRIAAAKTIPSTDPASESPASADVLNFTEALTLVGGNRELLCEVARIFLNQYPKFLEETHQALSRADCEALSSAAHALAASVGQLAGERAFAAAKKLEQVCSRGDFSEVPGALAELERELQLLRSAVSDPAYFALRPADLLH
jgi:two-component system, sensor histidine kinase and response regulator